MDWLTKIRNAEKTCLIQDDASPFQRRIVTLMRSYKPEFVINTDQRGCVKKVHYKFPDGEEMAEEYNMSTSVLVRRGWKRGNHLSKKGDWEVEVGDPEPDIASFDRIGLKENSDTPYIIKRITKKSIEWRIRNLPYPLEVYSVTAEPENKCLTVRTSNKKYFKKIPIPELERVNLLPEQKNIDFTYKLGTLIISYEKPKEVIQMENAVLEELKNVKAVRDQDLPCKPS